VVQVPPRPPLWLRKVCQSYLQQILSKPDGILTVLINTVHGIVQSVLASVEKAELKNGLYVLIHLVFFITFYSCTYFCFIF